MTVKLCQLDCVPCRGGTPPLSEPRVGELLVELDGDWRIVDNHHLARTFKFPDFKGPLAFVNGVGEVAEQQELHLEEMEETDHS